MIYINNIKQISIQEPLSDAWFDDPLYPVTLYNEGKDPDFKQFLPIPIMRRLGRLLRRATVTSTEVLKGFEAEDLDGIISGTGLGCIENTEKFLTSMIENDERYLQPTYFMQSTHNTIGSQVALYLKCKGYNNTYSHRGTSFDSALFDAYVQMNLGHLHKVIVGSHDELTPNYFVLLGKSGYWKQDDSQIATLKDGDSAGSISGICSLSALLSDCLDESSLCKIEGMTMLYKPDEAELETTCSELKRKAGIAGFDAVVTGISGDKVNDDVYKSIFSSVYADAPVIWYKHLFGESFSSSAFGVYTGALCLANRRVPSHLLYKGECEFPRYILVHNHFKNKDHSLVLLSL